MNNWIGILICFFSLNSYGDDTPSAIPIAAKPVAVAADRRPWQIGIHGGVYTESADDNVEGDWEFKLTESYLLTLRFNRTLGRPFLYFIGGFEGRHGQTVNTIGSSRIQVDVNRMDFQVGIGTEAHALDGFGGYAYFSFRILGSSETTYHGSGLKQKIQEDDSVLYGGLTGYYKISEAIRVSLTFEPINDSAVTTGLTYAY